MKRILFIHGLIIFLSACTATSTSKGLSAYDDNQVLEAIPFFEKGLLEGDKLAPIMLAMIYLSDTHVPLDIKKASFYHNEALELDGNQYDQYLDYYFPFIEASILLKDDIQENDSEALSQLRQARYLNFPPALILMANAYSYGKGVDRNYALANTLFLRSIDNANNAWPSLIYAWTLAAHDDADFRAMADPLSVIPQKEDIEEEYLYVYYDVVAAIQAKNGAYDAAILNQKNSIDQIKLIISGSPNYQNWLDASQKRLTLFESNKPYQMPDFPGIW